MTRLHHERLVGEPGIRHAKHRCLVALPDGRIGRLIGINMHGTAKVRVGGRHHRIPRHQLVALEHPPGVG